MTLRTILPHIMDGVPVADISRSEGIPVRTLWHWVNSYKSNGFSGLERKKRTDHGKHKIPPQLEKLIQGLCLKKTAPSFAAIHRQLVDVCAGQGWNYPGYSVVYDIACNIDPALRTLAHHGTKVYKEEFDLVYRRESIRSNQIWQADHSQLDCYIVDGKGKSRKPWITIILDDFSRAVCGYSIYLEAPSTLRTALTLRQAIWRKEHAAWRMSGIPEYFYTDHGSDFTSNHMEQVAADLKMNLIFSTIGMPRGRGKIERFFGSVNQLFLCHQPGYAPAGSGIIDGVLTLDQLDKRFLEWCLKDYLVREHSELGRAPRDKWEEGAFLPTLPESLEQLDLLLITVAKARKVHPDGIHFQGLRYLNQNLAAFVGEDVIIRYDPRDVSEISVLVGGNFLCRAICTELEHESVSLKSLKEARRNRLNDLRKNLQDGYDAIKTYGPAPAQELPSENQLITETQKSTIKRYEDE